MIKKRGGSRVGAGRKPLDENNRRKAISVRLAPELIIWLDKQPVTRTQLIEEALYKAYQSQL